MALAVLVLASDVLACGANGASSNVVSGNVVSCTTTDTGSGDPPAMLRTCHEISGVSASQIAQFRDSCMVPAISRDAGSTAQLQFENAACARDHAVGGCALSGGGVVTTSWSYESGGQTADDVRARCQQLGQTFVAP